jgi:glucose/arabinose dehydrogenase
MSPFGMALVGDMLYIANAEEIVRVPYVVGETTNTAKPESFFALPGGPINHHWTKNIVASADGTKLYAAVGSNSNVGENGLDAETGRAAIWEIDVATAKGRLFATGLRNPVGMDFSADGTLYTVVNERDELGDNLVPDYLTSVKDGAFYGWPYSYYRPERGYPRETVRCRIDCQRHRAGLRPRRAHRLARSRRDRWRSPGMSAAFGPAPSSASTVPGTVIRAAAMKSSSCLSVRAARKASQRKC